MVGNSLWKNLKILVDIDQKLEDIKNKIQEAKKLLEHDQQEIPKLEAKIKEEDQNLLQSRKNVDSQELIAEELKDKEKQKKKQLEKISNPKEFSAIEKEINSLSRQINDQDDILIKAWHQFEEQKNKFEISKKDKENKIIQLKEGLQVQQKSLKDFENQKDIILEEKEEAKKIIPEEWLSKYERMKNKVSDPIVPVLGTTCSACFYTILKQDLSKLKKSGVLLCRNCYRFLYYSEKEDNAKKETF
ncbi:hypothetical protein K9M16_04530 [Candidatus Babeliales bacterium]|nr:hypothetical protein [Candidatus Babeliales bacterium]